MPVTSVASSSPPLVPAVERLALSYSEVAEMLGCSPRTVWTLVDSGHLKAARIGRLVRIPLIELKRYLAAQLKDQSAGE